jgi:inositol-phosphate transport system permease protein
VSAGQAARPLLPGRFARVARAGAHLRAPALFLLPAGLVILLFFMLPAGVTIYLSLTDLSARTLSEPSFVGWSNYEYIFTSRWTPIIVRNTALYVSLTLAFNVVFGLGLAIVMSMLPDRVGNGFRLLWLLPRITSPVIYVLIWQALLAPAPYGLVSELLDTPRNAISSFPWQVVILSNGLIGASLGMLIFTAAIRSIPRDLFHASAVDGATVWQTVRRVVLPLLRWPIMFVTAYQTLSLLASFEYILLLTNGGPGFYTTEVWSLWAYKEAFQSYVGNVEFGLGAAMAAVLVLIGIIASIVYLRVFRFSELVSAPKVEIN